MARRTAGFTRLSRRVFFLVPTMSSLELVEFINAEREVQGNTTKLQHPDFLKKVPQVLGKDAGNFSSIYLDSMNREKPCYRFPKRVAIGHALEAELAKRHGVRHDRRVHQMTHSTDDGRTTELVAQKVGLGSGSTYERAKRAVESGTPELAARLEVVSPPPGAGCCLTTAWGHFHHHRTGQPGWTRLWATCTRL